MDTSTPLKKTCSKEPGMPACSLSNECYNEHSIYTKLDANEVFSNELPDSGHSKSVDMNCSVEVFLVSPISDERNMPSNPLPCLNSSNLKWSTSLHTSYADDDAVEIIDQMYTSYQYTTDENGANVEQNETGDRIIDESFSAMNNTSYVPCSPIISAARVKRRKKNKEPPNERCSQEMSGTRKSLSGVVEINQDDEALHRIRCLNEHALEFDDSSSKSFNICTPFENVTSKTDVYSLTSRKENSRKFIYPFANVLIKKPTSFLPVDQLTNPALTLEEYNFRKDLHSRNRNDAAKPKAKLNEFVEFSMVAFNELYDGDTIKATVFAQTSENEVETTTAPINCGNVNRTRAKHFRCLVGIIFACKNNDCDTIRLRFKKLADQYVDEEGKNYRGRTICYLYSMYYFLANVNLPSFKKEHIYRHDAIQNLTHHISNSFKLVVPFDYAKNLFDRFENDIFTLERIGIPVTNLYTLRSKSLRCLLNNSGIKMDPAEFPQPLLEHLTTKSKLTVITNSVTKKDDSTTTVGVLKNDPLSNFKRNVTGHKCDFTPSGFCTESGDRLSIPEKLIDRFVDRYYSDIIYDQQHDQVLLANKQFRQNKRDFAFITCSDIGVKPALSHNHPTFQTGTRESIHFPVKPLQESSRLFSDILIDTEFEFDDDSKNIDRKLNENATCGFKTCSGKTISIDDKFLQKSKNLFSDISDRADGNIDSNRDSASHKSDKIATSGFKTCSGKTISVHNKLLQKSKNLFSDISLELENDVDSDCSSALKISDEIVSLGFETFKTCSGSTINVDGKFLQRSRNLFSDISDQTEFSIKKNSKSAYKNPIENTTPGFKICSGRKKSRNLFSEISDQPQCSAGSNSNDAYKTPIENTTPGFKTCTGRTINVDNKLLQKSRNLFSDISNQTEFSITNHSSGAFKNLLANATTDFKTCSGRAIKVDDELLKKSTNLFGDISEQTDCNFANDIEDTCKNSNETSTRSLKICSDKSIRVDDKSSEVSNDLFSDLLNEEEEMFNQSCILTSVINTFNAGAKKTSTPVPTTRSKKMKGEDEPEARHEAESCSISIQNQSFDLVKEITESASAFLYDISSEQSASSFFIPNDSTANVTVKSMPENHKNVDISDAKGKSRSTSPVFDTKYAPSKRKNFTRKSGGAQSLNITFVRKTNNSDCGREQRDKSSGNVCAELDTFKMNFSFKSAKRKSTSLEDLQVTPKKSKNDFRSRESSWPQNRSGLAIQQERYVSNKPKEFCRPARGYYSNLIHNAAGNDSTAPNEHHFDGIIGGKRRLTLRQLTRYEAPKQYSYEEYLKLGLLPAVIRTNSQNARRFTFSRQFFSEEQLANGANSAISFGDTVPIILNEKNEITFEEIARGFLASPGVDPKLISREWIANHYRWIVWKLASTERFFPKSLGRRYLTLDNVLFQLKFKYEEEVDRCHRSALKRILEGDDSPARPIVLCVALIDKGTNSSNEYKIELTDGWYNIFAQVDDEMNSLIARKKILIGTKLITIGAELVGLREPCDPLQIDENVFFKFSANSCRRVRWDTQLGFYKGNRTPVNKIQTILPRGGLVSQLKAAVARVYPLLFLEKYDNATEVEPATGSWSRLHNEKFEMKKAMAYERDRQNFVESILSQVTNEVLEENGKTYADDPTSFPSGRDSDRLRDVIQQRVQSRLPIKFSKNRHVSRLLKLRLVDVQDVKNKTSAVLTIWNPCEEVTTFFKEDRSYNFFNINANYFRNGELQLNSTRSSKYDGGWTSDVENCWFRRCVRSVDDLNKRGDEDDESCVFDEVDVTGVIIKIKSPSQITNYEQNSRIYVADLQHRFFALSFRVDPKNFDFGDSIESGKIVAGLNLQWKKGWLCWKIPILYVSELSSFIQSTNIASLQSSIDRVRQHFRHNNLKTFVTECEAKLREIVESATDASTTSTNDNSCNHSLSSLKKTNTTPVVESNSSNQIKSTFQTTFKNANVASKFEKLQSYGRAPSLSPIVLTSQSKTKAKLPVLRKSFKS